jgi:putative CocE/NonD family hydrolase
MYHRRNFKTDNYICLLAISFILLFFSCGEISSQDKFVNIPMRDGVELATDLWFPETDNGPWPVLLVRTPYSRKSQSKYGRYFSKQGYVVAIQDVRGQYSLGGNFDLWNNEKQDGYDAIEWLAQQNWSTGKVGMIGGSYGGWVQLAAAVEEPPHLVTIIPIVTMGDPSRNHVYPNGMLHMTQHLQAISMFESRFGKGGSKYNLKSGWRNQLNSLPVIDFDLKLFGEKNKQWRDHISNKVFDPYWEKSNVLNKLEKINIPVFIIGGWYDFGGIGTKESYLHLSKSINPNIKLLIGPWAHHTLGKSKLMEYDFGYEAEVDLLKKELEWLNYWMKDVNNKNYNDSLVEVFKVGPNKWIRSNKYPLPQTDTLKLFLSNTKLPEKQKKKGKLTFDISVKGSDFDTYTYNPGDPTPYIWFDNLSDCDSIIDSRNDLLIYETEALENDYQVLGPISATIYASTSAVDTDWVLYYFLINEQDELEYGFSRGQVRARYRDIAKGDQLLEKDKIYKYEIDLMHSSYNIPAGYKIRVVLCSASFPHFSRNLNTGNDNETDSVYIIANQKIYHSEKYRSSIKFPVIKSKFNKNLIK